MTADMTDPMIDLDAPDLADRLERLSRAELDALPAGVVKIAKTGRVLVFSAKEAELSGFRADRAAGRDWFAEIAPCMDTPAFRGRLEEAAILGRVDIYLEHTGDFRDPDRVLGVRIMESPDRTAYWMVIQRLD